MTNLELYCKTFELEMGDIDKSLIPPSMCIICPIEATCEKMHPNEYKISNYETKFDYLDYLTDMECKWWDLDREE